MENLNQKHSEIFLEFLAFMLNSQLEKLLNVEFHTFLLEKLRLHYTQYKEIKWDI